MSFPFNEKLKKNSFLGDIAISYEIVKKRSHNSSFAIELDKMWIHGLLHLLGYNHKKLKDYYKMHNKEKRGRLSRKRQTRKCIRRNIRNN